MRPRSAAARQGITEGDVIVRLGRTEVAGADDAMRELQKVQVGQAIGVRLYRGGQEMFFTLRKDNSCGALKTASRIYRRDVRSLAP